MERDDATHELAKGRQGESPTHEVGVRVADPQMNSVTVSNRSEEPVAVVLRTSSRRGAGDAELCAALSLAIRDRATGKIVRTASATSGRAIEIARLQPAETTQYDVELQLRPDQDRPDGTSHEAFDGSSCPLGYAWALVPTRWL